MDTGLLISLIAEYKYFIMAPATLVFGPLTSVTAGVLLRAEVIDVVPTFLALAVGELTGDVVWYWVGRRWGERFVQKFGRYIGLTEVAVAKAKKLFEQYHDIIIFTSKSTSGFGFAIPIFFVAGLSRVPFKRYMMFNIAGQFLWTSGLVAVGYFLGHIYLAIGSVFEKVTLFALVIVIVVSIVAFGRYFRERLLETSV